MKSHGRFSGKLYNAAMGTDICGNEMKMKSKKLDL